MRRTLAVLCFFVFSAAVFAQTKSMAAPSAPPSVKDLPVRKVILYKNGVGYFEHAGQVTGTQKVAIDFTSPQLNDVLQTLTVLDGGGGRIGGVNYNSTTPLAEQLKSLSLGMGDEPTAVELFQALRGQRVEVTGGPGGLITGRLMAIESRPEKTGELTTTEKFYLTLLSSAGAARVIELTPALSVRPLDAGLQSELDRYLQMLSGARANGLRHLTLDAIGQGQRDVRVSYISEVPVWKATYRLVFPRTPNGAATLQGWAVVDNTVGSDWDNVQLSLVAGAPQSFIQQLSKPLYVKRPEIGIATVAQSAPTTHTASEAPPPPPPPSALRQLEEMSSKSESYDGRTVARAKASTRVSTSYGAMGAAMPSPAPMMAMNAADVSPAAEGWGVDHASNAIAEGDVTTKAFDDYFEYALTQPVTIHKNESAMVPILQQDLPAEHVTLWSRRQPRPLRAVWIENKSKLTLDAGSFSIFESGEFAGEGLLEAIHPGEKRLLSYANDQAVRVTAANGESRHALQHVKVEKGAIIESYMDTSATTYTAVNSADVDRVVMIEHPRRGGEWTLDEGITAAETAPDLYRFKLAVAAHSTAKLEVRERGPQSTRVQLNPAYSPSSYLLDLAKRVPDAATQLKPVIDAAGKLAEIDQKIGESKAKQNEASEDQDRARENLDALKGNAAAKRYVDELNQAEDRMQAAKKLTLELEQQKKVATEKFNETVSALSLDWDVKAGQTPGPAPVK